MVACVYRALVSDLCQTKAEGSIHYRPNVDHYAEAFYVEPGSAGEWWWRLNLAEAEHRLIVHIRPHGEVDSGTGAGTGT